MQIQIQLSSVALLPGSHIRGEWCCHDNLYIIGYGDSPGAALDDWLKRESHRSRLPRKGWWNLRDTYKWFAEGCPPIRYYIGRRQIVGYDPHTDELILRGPE